MRKESFSVGNYVHVYNRGNRKLPIVRDMYDKWRFLQMLYFFNTEQSVSNPLQDANKKLKLNFNQLVWPDGWPEQEPIVRILAFALMPNHFHLLLKETQEGGIARFMQKLGTGMTNYFNTKYQEVGSLFQGSYKARLVDEEIYIRNLSVYIQVKNPFELYVGGLGNAISEFDRAYEGVINNPYNSLADYAGKRKSPIIDKDILGELFKTPDEYKEFARDAMLARNIDEELKGLIFEER